MVILQSRNQSPTLTERQDRFKADRSTQQQTAAGGEGATANEALPCTKPIHDQVAIVRAYHPFCLFVSRTQWQCQTESTDQAQPPTLIVACKHVADVGLQLQIRQ